MRLRYLMEDMRGVLTSISSPDGQYELFFEWFFLEVRCQEWLNLLIGSRGDLLELEDVWSIVHLISELATNRDQRIIFPITSVNGLLLFRSTAEFLIKYGNFLRNYKIQEEDHYYKSLSLYVKCLTSALEGGYTNFGVFELYHDPILSDLLHQLFAFVFSLDLKQLEKYPKVSSRLFTLMERIVYRHTDFVVNCDSTIFGNCLQVLLRALHTNIPAIVAQSCGSLDKLVSLHLSNQTAAAQKRLTPTAKISLEKTSKHFTTHHDLLTSCLAQIINLIASTEMGSGSWALGRPMLSLMLLLPQDYEKIVRHIIELQPGDKQAKMAAAFTTLTEGIATNITPENREKFLVQMVKMQKQLKDFVDLHALLKATSGLILIQV
eukprot:TRINITY_DN9139_c0_g1_i1.p1 TRINITY_DN9139_c0_g1~~TRINITY_DN9139_c0_g1_i1.p1  ORF type:complete len:378 (-),score=78.86 TRINITY_DN9139_c0_g1_i1:212-1345(-)